jgi:maltose alpha-D-glucosyltransferase/alpha-amylase
VHGDYHLGQTLKTAGGFVLIDFEGEPARPLTERRAKQAALRDIAGMLRSFDYAAHVAMLQERELGALRPDEVSFLAPWADTWVSLVTHAFWDEYCQAAAGAGFLPNDADVCHELLRALMLEKALYEVEYELNNRPAWVSVPLGAVLPIASEGK